MSDAVAFLDLIDYRPHQTVQQMLSRILLQSRRMTGAEAGTIYLVRQGRSRRTLLPISSQNDSLPKAPRRAAVDITATAPSIAAYVARTGETLMIGNLDRIPAERPYRDEPALPAGYHRQSLLCFPLTNYQQRVVGVIELVNRRLPGRPRPVAFGADQRALIAPMAQMLGSHIEHADMLEKIRAQNAKLRQRNRLRAEQRQRIAGLQAETEAAFMLSINLLARAAEIYDEETSNHIVRVNDYSYLLATLCGMPTDFCTMIGYSAQLHDVGKMSVDAAVLKKQGALNRTERQEMMNHPIYGHRILSGSPRLEMAAEIALHHHEKWDGSGYPNGVAGAAIPLAARIVAVADVYDALRARRAYKPAFSHDRTMDILLNGDDRIAPKGHFDPHLLALLHEHHHGMDVIWQRLAD